MRRFYLVCLNPQSKGCIERYAAYEMTAAGNMMVVWGKQDPDTRKYTPAPGQTYSKRRNYPAFHYALDGGGYSKTQQIGEYLQQHCGADADIEVFEMSGHCANKCYSTAMYAPAKP
jgi:hypothetical protein